MFTKLKKKLIMYQMRLSKKKKESNNYNKAKINLDNLGGGLGKITSMFKK